MTMLVLIARKAANLAISRNTKHTRRSENWKISQPSLQYQYFDNKIAIFFVSAETIIIRQCMFLLNVF